MFSLHGEQYAVPITSVREIIRYTPPSATAAATGLIKGMISLRGRVLPVVDISSRLGRPLEVGSRTKILVLEVSAGALGLIVDNVDGVMAIPVAQIEPLPIAVEGNGLGEQIAAVGDRLIMLIDAESALGDVLGPRPAKPAPPEAELAKPATTRVAKPAARAAKPAARVAKPAARASKPAANAAKATPRAARAGTRAAKSAPDAAKAPAKTSTRASKPAAERPKQPTPRRRPST